MLVLMRKVVKRSQSKRAYYTKPWLSIRYKHQFNLRFFMPKPHLFIVGLLFRLKIGIAKMNTNIAVVSYNSDWPHQFNKEKQAILAHLSKENVAALHHIGSTSVPQLCAKPIVDMLYQLN
ncbi:GrpB family protein [Pseudoalteromonas flavipulchra]|nr:GrpB family protein [Pseudoalteromonas flavipulchra]